MAGIIKASINLSAIPKDKIIQGKKGKYLPISVSVNDEFDQFGNQGPVCVDQTKEEREAKAPKTYLGNVRVVWSNGVMPEPAYKGGNGQRPQSDIKEIPKEDLPF